MNNNSPSPKKETAEEIKREDAELNKMNYPASEDIYAKDKKLDDEPDAAGEKFGDNETLFENPGKNLDIPGADLDDADEAIGEEDEENNYYSLGGDNHEDLEETNDDNI